MVLEVLEVGFLHVWSRELLVLMREFLAWIIAGSSG